MPMRWTESELKIALNPTLTSKQAAQLLENRGDYAVYRVRFINGVKTDPEVVRAVRKEAQQRGVLTRAAQLKKQQEKKREEKKAAATGKPLRAVTHAWSSVFSADDRLLGPYHPSQNLRVEKYRAKVRRESQNVSFDALPVRATPKTAKAGSACNTRPAL